MEPVGKYLELFKAEAREWFARATFVRENLNFFREFFKRENLEKAEWPDIQRMGRHLHCFQSMAIARANALGDPNHPIEHYRNSFLFLAHGPGSPADRLRSFHRDSELRLNFFGESAISELAGYLFPEQFMFWNERDRFAVRFLQIEVRKARGSDLISRLEAVHAATRAVAEWYVRVVGKQTDLPLNLELDQFFSWLYEHYAEEENAGSADASLVTAEKENLNEAITGERVRTEGCSFWWLNANPKIWSFDEIPVGSKQTYTAKNAKGNKRQRYKYFQEAKPGDLVLGYVTNPRREVVAICRISKSLFETPDGESIEFEKLEDLEKPIPYELLQTIPDLANSEPVVNLMGSLFKLTEDEYELIRSLSEESIAPASPQPYTKETAMAELFMGEAQFSDMLDALTEKKNVVLQGPPGVGKTFVAKRLAYSLIGAVDPERVAIIQFHQSYSYEDFIQGFRPTAKGHFDLTHGIFYQFCRKAQRHEADKKPFVFVIDEINRGNLSKIFGELMMLIEPDKRGKEHAIPLAYSRDTDDTFYIPSNLYFIGTMNTADRSLAMVDYALRRRFRFITLRPAFASTSFSDFVVSAGAPPELVKKIVARMKALNEAVVADIKNLGPGYEIGHSYFCPLNGIEPDENWYRRVIDSEIVPLLDEYWFDADEKVQEHRSALLA